MLGRWETNGSSDYVQTRADIVRGIQDRVACSLSSVAKWYGEAEFMDGISGLMKGRGIDYDVIKTLRVQRPGPSLHRECDSG